MLGANSLHHLTLFNTLKKMTEKIESRRRKVQSAEVGMSVLKTLAALGGSASLTALSNRIEENPAKIHRYLASLVESDLVIQEPSTGHYVLGPEAITIGLAAIRQSDALTLGSMELARFVESFNISCFISVLGNQGPTIVRWNEPTQPVTVNVRVGSVMPVIWSATGRAFGAFSPSELLRRIAKDELKNASREQRAFLPNLKAVTDLYRDIRADGCAPVKDLLLKGISAVAAPIFDMNGKVTVVITALGPTGSFDPTPGEHIAKSVVDAAMIVSKRLGFRPSQSEN